MKNYCDISILLDRSGSMNHIKKDTLGGFNNFLEQQKEKNPTANITLAQFNTNYELVKSDNVRQFDNLTDSSFNPSGGTALIDSLAKIIKDTGHRLCKIPEDDRPNKVMVVVITDGEENSSTEFSLDTVKDMIKHQEEKYNWDFLYLGANQDAIQVGSSYGFKTGNSMSYNASARGVRSSFGKMSEKLALVGNNKVWQDYKKSGYFTEQDKEEVINNV